MNGAENKCNAALLKYFRSRLRKWGKDNFAEYPWRITDNKFHGLIAEIMLQRTNADQVVPVYENFTKMYEDPKSLGNAGERKIRGIFKPLGLHWRGIQLYDLIKHLNRTGGVIPDNYDELIRLSAIGPYAANAFLSFHHNRTATIIDSNIVRLYGRFFGIHTHAETRRKKEFIEFCQSVTPRVRCSEFNYSLLDFTRNVCKSKPDCNICPLAIRCCYNMK